MSNLADQPAKIVVARPDKLIVALYRGLLLIKKSDIKTFFTLNKEARASLISGALTKLDPAQYEKALQRSVGRVMNLDVKAVDVNKVVRFFMPPPSFLGSAVLPFGLG